MATFNPIPRRAAVVLLTVVLASCAKEPVTPPVYPSSGSVTFQKKPAQKAVVVLRPTAPDAPASVLPRGEVGADGKFRLSTFTADDGAPAGEYAVTITWPETKTDEAGDEVTKDRLKGRFNDPAKCQWKVQIKEGNNEVGPFTIE